MTQFLTILSAVLALAAVPPYLFDTIKRKTKPERATWFIFTALGVIAFISQLQLGATLSLAFVGADTLGSLVTFLLAIKLGVGGFTKHDKFALCVAFVGVAISIAVNQPIIAILGVIIADAAGEFLSARKAYYEPDSETTVSWLLFASGAFLSALVVGEWNLELLLFPVYLTIANGLIPVMQLLGRRR